MDFRPFILPVLGAVLAIAIVGLYFNVSSSPAHSIDEAALAKAEREYKSASLREVAATPPSAVVRKPRPRAPEVAKASSEPAAEKPVMPTVGNLKRGLARGGALKLPSSHPSLALKPKGAQDEAEDGEEPYEERRLAANKLYDRGRYPQSRKAALELLGERPTDRRMLRVVVSASCIMYEPDVAREYFQKLEERDRKTMRIRCARYEVEDLD